MWVQSDVPYVLISADQSVIQEIVLFSRKQREMNPIDEGYELSESESVCPAFIHLYNHTAA